MGKPLIVVVHGDGTVLNRLRHGLRASYGDDYSVNVAHDVDAVSDLLEHLPRAEIAAVLADVPALEAMAGDTAKLAEAKKTLVAPFDPSPEFATSFDRLGISAHLIDPWTDERLTEMMDDVLFDWHANHPRSGVDLIGHRWARHAHELKDFLGRNHIPYRWLDLDKSGEAREAARAIGSGDPQLPAVRLPDGATLEDPTVDVLADALGMHHRADRRYYDLAVVGGGPAGLAASVYGSSEGLSTVLIEKEAPGGQAGTSSRIENYLGFPNGVSGGELAQRALTQALRFGTEVLSPQEVTELVCDNRYKVLTLGDGSSVSAGALIVATGVTYRALHGAGLDRLTGAGVYYGAATTEALSAEGEDVFVVGAANSAGQGAMYFSKFARSVTMLIRGPDLSAHMSQYLIDQIEATSNISVRARSHVVEAHGEDHLEGITIESDHSTERVETKFVFVFIGAEPRNDWLGGLIATDDRGYLLTGPDVQADTWPLERQPFHLETSLPGVFAAGDVRHGSIRRVAGGVGEGSTAVQLVHRYLATQH